MIFYAYEIETGNSYHVGCYASQSAREMEMNALHKLHGDDIDTYAIGTVEAENMDEARDKVERGDWQYSQKI